MPDFVWPPLKRPPCGGWITPFGKAATLGDLHQHSDSKYTAVPVRRNITQVYNPVCTPECCSGDRPACGDPCCPPADCPTACPDGQPATVPPTPRAACLDPVTHNAVSDAGCRPDPCGPEPATLGQTVYDRGNCGAVTLPPVPCGATKIGDNCYATDLDPALTKDFSECRFLGFKNVLANKRWHGTAPFGAEPCPTDQSVSACGDCPGMDCQSSAMNTTPASKKYRTATISFTKTSRSGGAFPAFLVTAESHYNATTSVSKYGVVSKSATAHSVTKQKNGDGSESTTSDTADDSKPDELEFLLLMMDKCAVTKTIHLSGSCNPFSFEGDLTITRGGDSTVTLHFEPSPATYGYRNRYDCGDGSTIYSWDLEPGESIVNCDPNVAGVTLESEIVAGEVFDVSITLTDPYYGYDVMADLNTLLGTWDLTDHFLYPPRIDAVTNGGPLVCFNEKASDIDPFVVGWINPSETPWTDTDLMKYPTRGVGEIIGAPLPTTVPGTDPPQRFTPEPYFDFYHQTWFLDDTSGVYGYANPKFYGQSSHEAAFSCPHMTQWTDEIHHQSLPHGPFVFCSGINGAMKASLFLPHVTGDGAQAGGPDGVWASKWAEVIMFEKPPHNYQRPCGAEDAKAIDLTTLDCEAPDPLADALPRWPNTNCNCDDNGFVGYISAVSNTSPIAVTFTAAHGRNDGDILNFCNIKGCTAANGRRTIQVVSADTVQLFDADDPASPIAGDGGYTGGGSASITTGADKYWNDFYAKGNFVFKQFWYNFRDWWESYRCILQAYQRTKLNDTRAGESYCPDGDGHDCCPECPTLAAPDPVRFKVIDEPLVHECDGSDAGCSSMDVGNILEEGNERNGGSKWLQNVSCNQYCVVHSPCGPCMAYVQPSNQNFAIGLDGTDKAIDMPYFSDSGSQIDYFYGTLWIGRVEQWMPDPLWKPFGNGHELLQCGIDKDGETPCDSIVEDDGSCRDSHINLDDESWVCTFPQRPYEEAECAPPEGAPAMPAGSRIMGCKDYVANLNLDPPVVNDQDIAPGVLDCGSPYNFFIFWAPSTDAFGNVELDPYCEAYDGSEWPTPCGGRGGGHYVLNASGSNGAIGFPWTPWIWMLNQQNCVKNAGIFADDYKRNGTIAGA